MLITENITVDGITYLHNYSDAGFKIEQDGTGILYDDAIDPLDIGRTYTETDVPIDDDYDDDAAYAQAGRILLGEEE